MRNASCVYYYKPLVNNFLSNNISTHEFVPNTSLDKFVSDEHHECQQEYSIHLSLPKSYHPSYLLTSADKGPSISSFLPALRLTSRRQMSTSPPPRITPMRNVERRLCAALEWLYHRR